MSKLKPQLQIQNQFQCQQSYGSMEPRGGGRHCSKCDKTVLDFTQLSDREIAEVMMQNPQGVCARTRVSQMNRNLLPAERQKSRFYWPPLVAGLITAVVPSWASAQTNVPDYSQVWMDRGTPNCALLKEDTVQEKVQGMVVDKENGEPLPFANVYLEGTKIGAVTDFDGKFTLNIPDSLHSDSLLVVVTSIGYKTMKVPIRLLKGKLFLAQLEPQLLGDVAMVGAVVISCGPNSKPPFWYRVKNTAWHIVHPKFWFK